MKEYIEREAVLEICDFHEHLGSYDGVRRVAEDVRYLTAADVEEVKHGRWETVMLDHERMGCRPTAHYCSECHQITWFRTFYCPNCGAKMMEVRE